MKIALVFSGWVDRLGVNVSYTPEGAELSLGDFHGGSTFQAEIHLDPEQEAELRAALARGFSPEFWLSLDKGG
jgi:hypothetical protein